MITVAREDPRQPEICDLLAEADAYSASLYPAEERHPVDADFLAEPTVDFLVAREAGTALGCGALVVIGDGSGELKRIIVRSAARGHGVGHALLSQIEAAAIRRHLRLILLETGPLNHAACALYLRHGYRERGSFGNYQPGPNTVFMEKPLMSLPGETA